MIDYEFVEKLEGFELVGYVPKDSQRSGVTISTGIDLGQRTQLDMAALYPHFLAGKLRHYAMLKGDAARRALIKWPLHVTGPEASAIAAPVFRSIRSRLITNWQQSASKLAFEQLTDDQQTVIFSVAVQYGPDLERRAPKFWGHIIRLDWIAAVEELRDFGDDYPTRRNKEANRLDRDMLYIETK